MANEQTSVRDRVRSDLKEPRRYKVIIFNDDFTTMDFVVKVLTSVFFKSQPEAEVLMLDVHRKGSAVVGVYSYDVARSKVRKATAMARDEGFPLRLECKPL
ncbi:MAG: ATP-dependent Clp protease adaptor ClpS [Bacteroidales bacterium]